MTVITSCSSESCGQCLRVSSAVFEKPKSYPRPKNWWAPSIRLAASNSSVRMTPSASPSSLPMRFCPPSPRVSDIYAVLTFLPRASHAIRLVSSSSGCAAIHSTRIGTGPSYSRTISAGGGSALKIAWPAAACGNRPVAAIAAMRIVFFTVVPGRTLRT